MIITDFIELLDFLNMIFWKEEWKVIMDKARENTENSRKSNKIEEFKQIKAIFIRNKVVQFNKEMKYF